MPLWTPNDLPSGHLSGWYKADIIKGVADGANLSSWNDSSGNSNTLTQSTVAAQPAFIKNAIYSRPLVRFDKDAFPGDNMLNADLGGDFEPGTGDFYIALVAKFPTGTGTQFVMTKASSGTQGLNLYLTNGTLLFRPQTVGVTTNNIQQTSAADGEFHTVVCRRSTGVLGSAFDGSAFSTDNGTKINNGNMDNDANFNIASTSTGGLDADMDLAEALIAVGTLTDADMERITGYLAHKYDLTANLPSDHPYKSLPPTVSIPTVTWIGGGNPADITDPDNWSDGLEPNADKRCVIADRADSITTGNLVCKELCVLEGFTGNIGTTSSALNVTVDNLVIKAPLAQTYLDVDADTAFLENAGLGCKLEGEITTLHYSSPTKATLEMDTLVTVNVEGAGRLATLHLDKGVGINVGPYGSVKINGDVTTVNVSGGKVFCGDHVVNTFNINGGHVAYGGDTLTTLNIYAGEFDLGGNENTQVNITNLNLYGGFVDLQNAISAAEVTSLKTFGNGRIRLPLGTTTIS